MTVGVATFVGSIHILAVSVLIKASSWLNLGAATLTSSFELFCGMTGFLQPCGLVVKDCKPTFRVLMPLPIILQRLPDLIPSSEWLLQSLKSSMARVFVGVHSNVVAVHFSCSSGHRTI